MCYLTWRVMTRFCRPCRPFLKLGPGRSWILEIVRILQVENTFFLWKESNQNELLPSHRNRRALVRLTMCLKGILRKWKIPQKWPLRRAVISTYSVHWHYLESLGKWLYLDLTPDQLRKSLWQWCSQGMIIVKEETLQVISMGSQG